MKPGAYEIVSSAKKMDIEILGGILLLTCNLNINGPRIDPCGTPLLI